MFGTKKIYAKIINGKLVIRVGGGYMGIDEFMQHYGQQEIDKMNRMGLAAQESESGGSTINKFGDRRVVGGASLKRSSAAGGRSPKTKAHTNGARSPGARSPGGVRKKDNTSFKAGGMMAATDLEAQLRQIEKDAADGKIGDGYNILDAKK